MRTALIRIGAESSALGMSGYEASRYSMGRTVIGQIRDIAAVASCAAIRALSQVARFWTHPDRARQAAMQIDKRFMGAPW